MKVKRNIVVLCSSPLQVVNAKSAIDYLYKISECNAYIVINHHELTIDAINLIRDIAHKLNFLEVFDLSQYSLFSKPINLNENKQFNFGSKCFDLVLDKEYKYKYIKEYIDQNIGRVDCVFCRSRYSKNDIIFLKSCGKVDKFYGIEDGLADYIPVSWKYTTLNKYEIFLSLKNTLLNFFKVITCVMATRKTRDSIDLFYSKKIKFEQKFLNMRVANRVIIGDFFLKNVKKLYEYADQDKNIKVLIIGTLMLDKRFDMSILREVEIYNSIIDHIILAHKVNRKNIWYKPHPRLARDSWSFKKANLNCSIYPLASNFLSDVELCNKNISAVYSVGSTSLFYAKEIFGKESYLIDIKSEKVHPSTYQVYYHTAKKMDLKIVKIYN